MKYKTQRYSEFDGGLNTRDVPSRIKDNQFVGLLNFVYDAAGNPITRPGCMLVKNVGSRVTSIFGFKNNSGVNFSLATSAADILNGSDWTTSIKGSITVSDDFWMWRQYNNKALGVGYTTKLCEWSGTGNVAEIADANCPDNCWLLEIWNERAVVVSRDAADTLRYSKTGDHTDFTTTGVSGAGSQPIRDGGPITGILSWKRRFFVFKRDRIFEIIAGDPNTDQTKWNIHKVAVGIGCVSPHSIWSIGDDVIYLSEFGPLSLAATERFGDFAVASIAREVKELASYSKATSFYPGIAIPELSQYWISTKQGNTGINNEVHVLDHSTPGKYRWSKLNGAVAADCYGLVYDGVSGKLRLYIGSGGKIYRYGDTDVYADDGVGYDKEIISKEIDFGSLDFRKIFDHWFLGVRSLTGSALYLEVSYILDADPKQVHTETISIELNQEGGLWGAALWGVTGLTVEAPTDIEIKKRFSDPKVGRIAKSIQFRIFNNAPNQAFMLKQLGIEAAPESTQYKISEVA